jgi:uncharacterized protein YbaP (TraB family)
MTKNKLDLAGLIAAGLLAPAFFAPAQAGLYKCSDKTGRTYYQDKPCQDLIATRLPSWLTSLSGREEERAFLWKAVGEKGTVYLLGSPHYGMQTFYPLPQMVMDAFGNAQVVVVEADLWNIGDKERDNLLRSRGRYEGKSDSLDDHVKPVTWAKVVEVGKKLGFNEEMLRPYKPWRAALLLGTESLKQAGYTPELSVAQTFIRESQTRKPVVQMGSAEDQIKEMEELSDREQEQLLLQTLAELGRAPDLYKNIAEAWKKGDAESMDQITRQSYDLSGDVSAKLFKIFFEDSNEKIANRLKEMAADDKILFVVVGAGRLGGDKGILKLLQDRKFNVTQP